MSNGNDKGEQTCNDYLAKKSIDEMKEFAVTVLDFFLARVHETWMKESFSVIDRYLLWTQCNYTKHFQMHLLDSVECFVL